MALTLSADSVENPASRQRIAEAADLLGASYGIPGGGRLIAVENTPQASDVYGRPPLRGTATLAVGHERRGLPRATLAAAEETVVIPTASRTVTTLNVAAAAAVAGWYVLHGSGPQARAAHPGRRWPTVLLSGDDHVEVGSSLRSAAAFGLREVLLDDRGAGWFDGPHAIAAKHARRHAGTRTRCTSGEPRSSPPASARSSSSRRGDRDGRSAAKASPAGAACSSSSAWRQSRFKRRPMSASGWQRLVCGPQTARRPD